MKRITRSQAIEDIRRALLALVDEDTSVCQAVAQRELFCHGFGRWDRAELERRFPWILAREPGCTRREVERQANRWQLGRQDRAHGRLPCDIEAGHYRALPCAGWDEFFEADLARFHRELCGREVEVVPDELVRG